MAVCSMSQALCLGLSISSLACASVMTEQPARTDTIASCDSLVMWMRVHSPVLRNRWMQNDGKSSMFRFIDYTVSGPQSSVLPGGKHSDRRSGRIVYSYE